jgi:hypothetical protein
MSAASLNAVLVVLVVLAGVGVVAAFRSGARSAYRVARQTQQVTRMGRQPGPGPGQLRSDRGVRRDKPAGGKG